MKQLKKMMWWIWICLFISSFSLLFSFGGDFNGSTMNKIFAYATGLGFWLGLLIGYILLFVLNRNRKRYDNTALTRRAGIICFFSNRYATVFDILLAVSLIVTVLFFVLLSYHSEAIIALCICLFSLHMHIILNGINFQYIYSDKKGENADE